MKFRGKFGWTAKEGWLDRGLIAFATVAFVVGVWSAWSLLHQSEPVTTLDQIRQGQVVLGRMAVGLGAGLMALVSVGLATSRRTAARNQADFLAAIEGKASAMRAEVDALLAGRLQRLPQQGPASPDERQVTSQ